MPGHGIMGLHKSNGKHFVSVDIGEGRKFEICLNLHFFICKLKGTA